jgi:cell division protein FtsQ
MTQRRRPVPKRATSGFKLKQLPAGWLKLSVVIAVVMVVLGGVLGGRAMLNNPENLPISQIDVQGNLKFIKDEDLRKVIEKYTQTNLHLLDAEALVVDLETQPWVRGVTLRKSWPTSLVVVVEEQVPLAFWGKERLMNQFGELFTAELPGAVLPTLYSPEDKGREMAERFITVNKWLQGLPLELSELTEDARGSWRMKLKGGPEVLIGTEEHERRIARFKVGFQRELASKLDSVRRIDLRYTNGFAVEWRQSPLSLREAAGESRRS